MYFLLAYPEYFENLRKEIDETFPYGKEIEVSTLSSMKLLNGIMCVPSSSPDSFLTFPYNLAY